MDKFSENIDIIKSKFEKKQFLSYLILCNKNNKTMIMGLEDMIVMDLKILICKIFVNL